MTLGGSDGSLASTSGGTGVGLTGVNGFSAAPVRYFDGALNISSTDLGSFGFGTPFSITRSWANVNKYANILTGGGGGKIIGKNWYINELPLLLNGGGETYDHVVTGGATDARFFSNNVGTTHEAKFGAQEKLVDSGTGFFTMINGAGDKLLFEGDLSHEDDDPGGKLVSITDAAGQVTEFKYEHTSGLLGISEISRWTVVGETAVKEAYVFSYDAGMGADPALPVSIRLERRTATPSENPLDEPTWGSATIIREASYEYYGSSDSNGTAGDLKRVRIKDGDGNVIRSEYYRYYTSDTSIGYTGGLQYVLTGTSYDRAYAALGDPDDLGVADEDLAPYADLYLEYDSSHRVKKEVAQGAGCTVCTAGQGTYVYDYGGGALNGSTNFNQARYKTVVYLPDTTPLNQADNDREIVYSNFIGEPILKIIKEGGEAGQEWRTYWQYNSQGQVIVMAEPSAVDNSFNPDTSGTHTDPYTSDIIGFDSETGFAGIYDDRGLVHRYSYYSSTTATLSDDDAISSGDGGAKGFLARESIQRGDGGGNAATTSPVTLRDLTYYAHEDASGHVVYPIATDTVYSEGGEAGDRVTSYAYSFFSGTNAINSTAASLPAVSLLHNGSNTTDTIYTVFNEQGQTVWTKDAAGYLAYFEYDFVTGAMTKLIDDVDTANDGDFDGSLLPNGWSGSGYHFVTTIDVDPLGRPTKVVKPTQQFGDVATYYFYDDVNHTGDSVPGGAGEVRIYPNWSTSTHTTLGPAIVYRTDRSDAGDSYDETLTFSPTSFNYDTVSGAPAGDDLFTAAGVVTSDTRNYYNNAGQMVTEDRYFDLPATWSGTASYGSINTNFYRTQYRYDETGKVNRVQSPTGTITRYEHDALKRVTSVWTGTDDTNAASPSVYWEPANADLAEFNLGKVADYVYDDGGSGSSNLTDIIQHVQHVTNAAGVASDDRHSVMRYDWLNRLVATKSGQKSKQVATLTPDGTIEEGDKFIIRLSDDAGWSSVTVEAPSDQIDDLTDAIATAIEDAATDTLDAARADRFASVVPTPSSTDVILTAADWHGFFHVSVTTVEYNNAAAGEQTFVAAAAAQVLDESSTTTLQRPITYLAYNNANEILSREQYDGDNVSITTSNGIPDAPSATLRRSRTTTEYDDRGRVFASHAVRVDPANGTYSGSISVDNNYWYDKRGNLVKAAESGGLVNKYTYDGVGRLNKSYVTDGGGDTASGATDTWATAQNTVGDIVLTQTENQYDEDGNLLFTITKDRFDSTPGTDELGSVGSSTKQARVSYVEYFYDAAGRLTATVNLGTNGATTLGYRPDSSVPTRSDTKLVTSYAYSASEVQVLTITGSPSGGTFTLSFKGQTASFGPSPSASSVQSGLEALSTIGSGNVLVAKESGADVYVIRFTGALADQSLPQLVASSSLTGGTTPAVMVRTRMQGGDRGQVAITTDPRGYSTLTNRDGLGRVTDTIEAYADAMPGAADDRITQYGYDGAGHVATMTAVLTDGQSQTTTYGYGVTVSGGSKINSNDLLASVTYPATDNEDTETFKYDAFGGRTTYTDRNGSVHAYTYDAVGRTLFDEVTTLGSGVNGAVRKLGFTFDSAGRPEKFTSYNSSGTVLNQVLREYNGFGQLTREWQEHDGTVVTSGGSASPKVEYAYSETDGGTENHSRLESITYPNGRVQSVTYSSGINSDISRPSTFGEKYLGLSTVVARSFGSLGADVAMSLVNTGTLGDDGDQYTLDRFGRISRKLCYDENDSTPLVYLEYGYDRSGNRLWKKDLVNSALSELYMTSGQTSEQEAYDGLNRLTGFARGTLSDANSDTYYDTVSSPDATAAWELDALGNWTAVTHDGTTEDRQHNAQNQITDNNGDEVDYDDNGNLTQNGQEGFAYDAWNRLVLKGGWSNAYEYDAMGRRIVEPAVGGNPENHLYYSDQWQVLEERVSGVTKAQNVWSGGYGYVDELILRDRDADADAGTGSLGKSSSGLEQRVYAAQDANYNVVAVINDSAGVDERYAYDPYGSVTVLDYDGSADSDNLSDFGMVYLHQGGRYDARSELYSFRTRDYSPTLGRWVQQDFLRYADSANLYGYVRSNPTGFVDPEGLSPWDWTGCMMRIGAWYFYEGENVYGVPPSQYRPPGDDDVYGDQILYEFFNRVGPTSRYFGNDSYMTRVMRDAAAVNQARLAAFREALKKNGSSSVKLDQNGTDPTWDITRMLANRMYSGWGNMGFIGSYHGEVSIQELPGGGVTLRFRIMNRTSRESGSAGPADRPVDQYWDWTESYGKNPLRELENMLRTPPKCPCGD